jgi:hypothetical protein
MIGGHKNTTSGLYQVEDGGAISASVPNPLMREDSESMECSVEESFFHTKNENDTERSS